MKKPRKKKHLRLAALLEERIKRGDYALVGFPGVREVAAEADVCAMTAHRAMQELINKGVVERRPRGRGKAGAKKRRQAKGFTVAFLLRPGTTEYVWAWHRELEEAAAACGATVRAVICHHWNDAVLAESLRGFDGVFSFQFPTAPPPYAQSLMANSDTPVVSMDQDLSALGIPSILAFPSGGCRTLLEHLYSLGHRRIGCLNVFPEMLDIPLRIAEWQIWMAEKQLTGPLFNDCPPMPENLQDVAKRAHRLIVSKIKDGGVDATALVCTTAWVALGVMRGIQECGLRVGRDVSLAVMNDEGMAEMVYPSLTSIRMPDVTLHLKNCIRWMMRGGKWKGSLRMMPAANQLFVGQSTAPAKTSNLVRRGI